MYSKDEFQREFGRRLQRIASKRSMGNTELSQALGWIHACGAMTDYLRGNSTPQTYTLCLLAEIVDVNADYLFTRRPIESPGIPDGAFDVKAAFDRFVEWAGNVGMSIREAEQFVGIGHIVDGFYSRVQDAPGADTSAYNVYAMARTMGVEPSELLHVDWRPNADLKIDQIAEAQPLSLTK